MTDNDRFQFAKMTDEELEKAEEESDELYKRYKQEFELSLPEHYTVCRKCGDMVPTAFGNNYYYAYAKCPTCNDWLQYSTIIDKETGWVYLSVLNKQV